MLSNTVKFRLWAFSKLSDRTSWCFDYVLKNSFIIKTKNRVIERYVLVKRIQEQVTVAMSVLSI